MWQNWNFLCVFILRLLNQVAGLGFSNEASRFKKRNIPKVWSQVAGPGSPYFIYSFFNQVAGLG